MISRTITIAIATRGRAKKRLKFAISPAKWKGEEHTQLLYQVCPRERGTIFTETLSVIHYPVYLLQFSCKPFKRNHHLPRNSRKVTLIWIEGKVKAYISKEKKVPKIFQVEA